MADTKETLTELRRVAQEIELQIHLASMDMRSRWEELKPRIASRISQLEHDLTETAHQARSDVDKELHALRRLRKDLTGE